MGSTDDQILDYDQAEALTRIKKSTLAAMVSKKQIPHIRIGPRHTKFSSAALRAWLDERKVAAQAEPSKGDRLPQLGAARRARTVAK